MSEQDGFDAGLAARFEQDDRNVPADDFVGATMRKVRAERRRREIMRVGLRAGALVAAAVASPWLIAGVEGLNAAMVSILASTAGLMGAWVMGALVIVVVVATRLRRRG